MIITYIFLSNRVLSSFWKKMKIDKSQLVAIL